VSRVTIAQGRRDSQARRPSVLNGLEVFCYSTMRNFLGLKRKEIALSFLKKRSSFEELVGFPSARP